MGYKEQILKLLDGNKYTTKELAEKLNIDESDIRVYLHRIQQDDKEKIKKRIKNVGTENKYKIYTLNKSESENGTLKRANVLIDKFTLLMIKSGLNSENYEIKIKESEIEPSLKRLMESGKIG